MIDVLFLSYNPDTPKRGYWDMGVLDEIFTNKFSKVSQTYEYNIQEVSSIPENLNFAVVVLPARAQVDYIDIFNEELKRLNSVLIFIVGDEEASFPVDKISHQNSIIYMMSAVEKFPNTRPFINGYPPQIRKHISDNTDKTTAFFFSGQITHERRKVFAEALRKRTDGVLIETEGFTQGVPHEEYYTGLAEAKVAPCPSGPKTPDTFRLYEALELGCVPIADHKTITNDSTREYWTHMFEEEPPFPVITEDTQINGYIDDTLAQYPTINNKVFSWWINYKRKLAKQIYADINKLSGLEYTHTESVTALISISPIKSNPSTKILEETMDSIRHHLPSAEIILMFDGVRSEQESFRTKYEIFINRVLHLANTKYSGIVPVIFQDHSHQTKMTRECLPLVDTTQILFIEQDTPLCTDVGIDFPLLSSYINDGISNMIRFHFEASIPEPHKHMMHGMDSNSKYLLRTSQWSQRPHLASKYFYVQLLRNNFSEGAICFIEDKMHGVLDNAVREGGLDAWNQFKVHVYIPEENIKRSYNLDGRQNEKKWDETQIW